MAVTFTLEDEIRNIIDHQSGYLYASSMFWGVLALDNNYPSGGYDVSSLIPQEVINNISLSGRHFNSDYSLEYDDTNKKLKVKERNRNIPWFVYEEPVTVTDDVGTLVYKPGHILYIAIPDGNAFVPIAGTGTPSSGTVAVDMAAGTLTFFADDSVTDVVVTYYPRWGNPWMADNLVEAAIPDNASFPDVTRTGDVITIAGGAAAIGFVNVDAGSFKLVIDDDTPGSGECKVLWDDGDGNTQLTAATDGFATATTIKITYLKDPGFLTYIEDDSAHTADVVTIAKRFYLLRTAIWLYTDDNDVPHQMVDSTETLAANEVQISNLLKKYLTEAGGVTFTYEGATDVAASGIPYAEYSDIVTNRLGDYAEVEPGRDLSAKSLGVMIVTERHKA